MAGILALFSAVTDFVSAGGALFTAFLNLFR